MSTAHRHRRVRRDHRAVGLGQVDADAHPRLPRRPDLGHVPARRPRRRVARRGPARRRCATSSSASCSSSSTCSPYLPAWRNVELPLVYAGVEPAERRERALAALDTGRARRPGRPPPGRALGRSAAAGRDRAGARDRAGDDPRRRADRQPRLDVDRRRARPASTSSTREGRTIVLITHEHDIAAARRARSSRSATVGVVAPGRVASRRGAVAMSWRDTFRTATEAVRTHRLRSALTMLGILIGITAVVLTVGLGQGAQGEGAGPDQRARHEPARGLARQLDEQHRGPRRLRLGVDARPSRTPTRCASTAAAPDVQAVAPASTTSASLANGVDELDDDAHRHDAGWTRRSAPAASRVGRFITAADERQRGRGRRARPRHRERAVRRTATRSASTVSYNGVTARGGRRARGAELVGARRRTTTSRSCRSAPITQRLVGGTNRNSVELDLREGDVRRRRCRPRTRRRTRCC